VERDTLLERWRSLLKKTMREKRTKKKKKNCVRFKKNEKKKSKKHRENGITKKIEIEEKRGERDILL
jgi:hypothetical protein